MSLYNHDHETDAEASEQETEDLGPFPPMKTVEFELSHRAIAELNHVVDNTGHNHDTVVNWLLLNCAGQAYASLD
jgi:hypothetical protein